MAAFWTNVRIQDQKSSDRWFEIQQLEMSDLKNLEQVGIISKRRATTRRSSFRYFKASQEIIRFRDELLNGEIFYSLREAQIIIEEWRKHYNTKRPHSALGYRPPAPEANITLDQRPIMH